MALQSQRIDQTNSKTIAAVVVFAALAVALNLSPLKVPAPYAPFLYYQIWEIPIVVAFLLLGTRVGVIVSIINTVVLFVWFPGALPSGPLYNLAAVLSTFAGMLIAHKAFAAFSGKAHDVGLPAISTGLGAIARVAVMSIVNLVFLPVPWPVGFGLPADAVAASLPAIGFFNATLALYTVPLGYLLARIVSLNLRTVGWNQRP